MKCLIREIEWYPIYEIETDPEEWDLEDELPEELYFRWLNVSREFEKVQEEISICLRNFKRDLKDEIPT